MQIKLCEVCKKEINKGSKKYCSTTCYYKTNKLKMAFKGSVLFKDIL